jgi:hypothetical protein
MALSSSNAAKQLSDGNSQGTILGQSAADKIGFYNVATPVAKVGTVALGSGSSFASLSQSSGALSSSLAIALHNLGLIACSTVAA